MYLDDMLVMTQSREQLERRLPQIMLILESLGFVINKQKFQLLPTQTIQYLGFLVDSREMKITLTEEKACSIDHNSLQEGQRERIPVNKRVGQADWQDDSNTTSCLSGPIVVSRTPVPEEPHVAEVPVIRDISEVDPGSPS